MPRWWRTLGRPSGPGSMATRSTRSGSAGQARPSGSEPASRSAPDGPPERRPLAPVERLLREPEVPAAAPAHLHDHQLGRRPGVHRHDVQLVPAQAQVPGEDRPARGLEPDGDQPLAGVPDPLRRRRPGPFHRQEHGPGGSPPAYLGAGRACRPRACYRPGMRRIDVTERRARLALRHHLAPGAAAADAVTAARDVVGLHASDPMSVYLAARARTASLTPEALSVGPVRRSHPAPDRRDAHDHVRGPARSRGGRARGLHPERRRARAGQAGPLARGRRRRAGRRPVARRRRGRDRGGARRAGRGDGVRAGRRGCRACASRSRSARAGRGRDRWASPRGSCSCSPPRDASCAVARRGRS